MRSTLALALAASLGLFACAGTNEEAKSAADDENVWKGYTGDYAASSAEFAKPTFSKSAASPMKREPKGEEVAAPEKKEAAPAEKPAAKAKEAPAPAVDEPVGGGFVAAKKPTSKGTVKGESISTLSEAQLTAGALAATKSKSALSSGTMTGKQYEVITVETKKGTIKITRPAATPNPNGPAVTSPSNKLGDIAKNESAWFDEEGDCIVVVSSPKKASSAKLLNSIVKH
jgi:hypothetical protein